FLQNFSCLEISFTSSCIPRYLYNLSTGDRTISYSACLSQLFFIYVFAIVQFFLLTIMSYDRYVAICKPLHYVTIMNRRVCIMLVFCCWMTTLLLVLPFFILLLGLEFCDSNAIDHFGCDAHPLLNISCSDTEVLEQMLVICSVLIFILTLVCVVLSYFYIIRTILRFPSAQQRKKPIASAQPCATRSLVVRSTLTWSPSWCLSEWELLSQWEVRCPMLFHPDVSWDRITQKPQVAGTCTESCWHIMLRFALIDKYLKLGGKDEPPAVCNNMDAPDDVQ
ncbi:PREDICTED: olfactory receptor 6C2-like, partial [Condylura cristata]|uniref:olfactory receptor 6C2-like n=1 Tax=Condylura cristata TaxID=143302 RepID=UPI00064308C0